MKFVLPLLILAFSTHAFIFLDYAADKNKTFLTTMVKRFQTDTPKPVKHVDSPQCDIDQEVNTSCVCKGQSCSCCKEVLMFGGNEVCMNCTNLSDPKNSYCLVSVDRNIAFKGHLTAIDPFTYNLCLNDTSSLSSSSFCVIIECVDGNSQCARYTMDSISITAGMDLHFDIFYGCYKLS